MADVPTIMMQAEEEEEEGEENAADDQVFPDHVSQSCLRRRCSTLRGHRHHFDASQIVTAVVALGEKSGSTLHAICNVLRDQCQDCDDACNVSVAELRRQIKRAFNEGILNKQAGHVKRFVMRPIAPQRCRCRTKRAKKTGRGRRVTRGTRIMRGPRRQGRTGRRSRRTVCKIRRRGAPGGRRGGGRKGGGRKGGGRKAGGRRSRRRQKPTNDFRRQKRTAAASRRINAVIPADDTGTKHRKENIPERKRKGKEIKYTLQVVALQGEGECCGQMAAATPEEERVGENISDIAAA
ncbi:hypothetical protein V1264_012246 [Littorina saxatilis]|uniref:H15 domain-containing protein n=1 Tax=Littorina saxatilis TaxID=31220 RepID=A0AAN9GLR9_9CAEN